VNGKEGRLGIGDALGDLRILDRLGEGGMGIVYLARDERLDRRVAVKVIVPQLAKDPDFRERFITEARSAAAIDHPNAVPIYSAGVADDALYIAMRYIAGTDLRTVLEGAGPIAASTAIGIVAEIAAALDAAHAAGMVHRDVKPANILLEGEPGEAKSYLTDFGLTKGRGEPEAQLTGTGQWVGTIDYVAPEQIQGGRVDARTDVYALGCVLYEALSGSVPFAGNDMQKMWGHVNEPFPKLEQDRSGELAAVIARATAKDPDDRFPSAGDLARAATAALTGETVDAPERSVATGSAASGLTETASSAPATAPHAPTATGRAPIGPRDRPTTQMPSPPERHGSAAGGGSSRTAAIIGGALVIAAGLIAAAVVIAGGSSTGNSSSPAAGNRHRDRVGTVSTVRDSPSPTSTLPPDTEPCGSDVYVNERRPGHPYTSCPFALEVANTYYRSGESAQITAYSPRTRRSYRMRCGGSNPVLCTGGAEAAVYIMSPSASTSATSVEPTEEASYARGDWPGGSGYSAMLGAFSVEAHARTREAEASGRGLEAGVLYSSDFSSLTPGYWIVFSGDFSDPAEAEARAAEARTAGFTDSYSKLVAP
jgi:serine/threonine-protein kinase